MIQILLPAALFCGMFAALEGEEGDSAELKAHVETVMQLPRTGAPVSVKCELKWNGSHVLEGYLEYEVHDVNQVIGRFRTNDVVLSDRPQELRLLIPPFEARNAFRELDIYMKFVGKTEARARSRLPKDLDLPLKSEPPSQSQAPTKTLVFDLDKHFVRMPSRSQTLFTVCLCEAWDISIPQSTLNLEQRLGFDRLVVLPEAVNNQIITRIPPLATEMVHISPNDMPGNPLNYCSYDMVVLTRAGFAGLRDRQMQAIEQWVAAGGSLCVATGGTVDRQHLQFLNTLAQGDRNVSSFVVDPEGNLQAGPGAEPAVPILLRKGLGRVVVLLDPSRLDFSQPEWMRALAFLWNIRNDRVDEFESGRVLVQALPGLDQRPADLEEPNRFLPPQSGTWLSPALMPKTVRVVPLSWIGVILGTYVLLVGPVDFFVLGRLKMRKLTWVIFPIVTLGFTGFTVLLANQSMQTTDQRQTISYFDIGEQGKIVRTNRFDLLFTSIGHSVKTEVRRGMFLPLNRTDVFATTQTPVTLRRPRNPNLPPEENKELVGATGYVGGVPTHYTAHQMVPQWTPQVNRLLLIAPEEAGIAFDWDAVTADELQTTEGRERLLARLQQACGEPIELQLLTGNIQHVVPGSASGRSVPGETFVQPAHGLFGLMSRIAPTGGKNLADLALLDSSDPGQWLVVATIRRENDLVIYRKLYHLP